MFLILYLLDFNTMSFGMVVPKSLRSFNSIGSAIATTNIYYAMNAEILTFGYLRALEVYAEMPGSVTFAVIAFLIRAVKIYNRNIYIQIFF